LNYLIEIATTDFTTTRQAVEGGADRIELCSALSEGGTTPTYGTIKKCRHAFDVALFPIIRPRSGDFLYDEEEFSIMEDEVLMSRQLGCDGVVIGLLLPDGRIDLKRTERLVQLAYPMEVTFHRAFDRCLEPFEAMESLIRIGCQRILTSGQKPAAPDGVDLIADLVKEAGGRICIMPGSGVRKENVKSLAEKTGAMEFHSSLRSTAPSGMRFHHPAFAASKESYTNPSIDPSEVRELRKSLHS
jgi:copper homeostasis protein